MFSIRYTENQIPVFFSVVPRITLFFFFFFFSTLMLWHWLDFSLSSYGRLSLFRTLHILCWRFFSLSLTSLTPESWKHYTPIINVCALCVLPSYNNSESAKCNKISQCYKFACESVFVNIIICALFTSLSFSMDGLRFHSFSCTFPFHFDDIKP